MIRKLLLVNLMASLLFATAFLLIGTPQQAMNSLFAGLLSGINLAVIVWTLQKIFQKKSVAQAIWVIVFKYATLLGLFVFLYKLGWRLDFAFAIGLSAMFPTLGYLAYKYQTKNETNDTF
jgi:hypothetical protein